MLSNHQQNIDMSWWWVILAVWLAPAILIAVALLWRVRRADRSPSASIDGSPPSMDGSSQAPELSGDVVSSEANASKARTRRRV